MGAKGVVLAGLLAGAVTGAAAIAAAVVFAPLPQAAPIAVPSPTPVAAVVSPSAAASLTASPSSSSPDPSVDPSLALASPTAGASPTAATGGLFGVGKKAPSLALPSVGGGSVSLGALLGKPIWVNFMATWCPSCRDELPVMNGLAARYAGTGLQVLLVDVGEDEAVVTAYLDALGVDLPVGLDTTGLVQSVWKAKALPVHFWIDPEGIVRYGALGSIGPDIMVEGLKSILPGVDVTP